MSQKYFPQPSVMDAQAHFSRVPKAEIERSRFDRSSGFKSTFNAGYCVPCFVDELVPGDTFNMSATHFARLATPLKPVMDNAFLDTHFFFVPCRLVWDNWPYFMGERKKPTDNPKDFSVPQAAWNPQTALTHATGGAFAIGDYLGLPKRNTAGLSINVSALPLRAIYLIWNEWFRDENLQDPITFSTGDIASDINYNQPVSFLPRGKRKDYFTSCLPWPQKGDPIMLPLAGSAPVQGIWFSNISTAGGAAATARPANGTGTATMPAGNILSNSPFGFYVESEPANTANVLRNPKIYADLSQASATTINALRTAFQLQRMLERDARGGTRYIEMIYSHFGVINPDFRLQRPEFLGSGSAVINMNPIAATFTSSGNAPQGNLSAVGTTLCKAGFSYSATEHGYIIGFVSARTDLTYQQGVERFWTRKVREEWYFPALAHLGEQAVLRKEIYIDTPANNDVVFGYQERFAEYRYKPSRITGLFASEEAQSLDVWHWSQDFANAPQLNSSFIVENPPIARTIAVPSEPHFLLDSWFKLLCDRPMPVYSVPGLIDHF